MTTTAAPKTLATENPPQGAGVTAPVRREEPKDFAPRDFAPKDFVWAMRCVEREVYDLP